MPTSSHRATAAVATPHPLAAAAAREVFLQGGKAVDAAVAAMLACCVCMPGAVGLGGYGGSLVGYLAREKKTIAISFDSRAPLSYRPELFAGTSDPYNVGYLAISVPAVVAGLALALERFGTLPWSVVSSPAIALAEGGVRVTAELKRQLEEWARKADPASRQALFPGGAVPAEDTLWAQREMAGLLRRLAQEGPGAFYRGDIPRTIARQIQDNGGILSEDDFVRCQAEVVEPIGIDYRGYRVLTPPPPSGGLTSLQILKTLEPFDLAKQPPGGVEYFHLFAEAAKRAWQDRVKTLGDPAVTPIPVDQLLSEEMARTRAAQIREGGITRAPGSPSDPSPPHTVNIVAADPAGNLISMTATHGGLYGSAVVIDGFGLVMGHGMSRFDLAQESPNAPAAGKRMFHNMAPTLIVGPDGKAFAAVGLPGGRKIVTVTAQLVIGLVDFGFGPSAAVHAGRIHVEADEPVAVSSAVPDAVVQGLAALGHTVRRGQDLGGPPDEIGGTANALVINPRTGEISAVSQAGENSATSH